MKIQDRDTSMMEVDNLEKVSGGEGIVQKRKKRKRKEQCENAEISMEKINGTTEENGIDENAEPSDELGRKRKLKEISNGSKKKKKKLENSELEQKTPSTENNNENAEENDESSDEKITKNENKMFNGKYLRKSFVGPDGLNVLQKFLVICKENKERDLAAEYLLAGGNLLEILRLLDTLEKRNMSNISTVFSAIHILLMKILAKYPQYLPSAEEACRHLINSHLSSIHSMLSAQSGLKRRKIVLKLLVSMISLGGSLPREILAHLSISSQSLEGLVKHTKPSDPENVRTCFIHLILAFLVEGNTSIIRSLLERRIFLLSLFPGMIHDSRQNVNLILNALKTFVLENPGISKTLKLGVFSTPVVQNIVSLYNWKGPGNWPPGKTTSYATSDEFKEEKEITVSIVHDFLLTLLTSHRHGIIFHDRSLGTSGSWHNQLANTIILSLDRPWEHEKPSELVLGILRACPDLVKSQFQCLSPSLEPRFSEKWVRAIKFLGKIVESMEPEVYLKNSSTEITSSQLFSAITSLTLPSGLLRNYILPSTKHDRLEVRREAISLLSTMLKSLKKFLSCTEMYCASFVDLVHFRNNITDYAVKNLPNVNDIFNVWEKALTPEENGENVENQKEDLKAKHFGEILELLHDYREICPEFLETSRKIQPNTLLGGLNDLKNLQEGELNSMKVKAIQLLLVFDPREFLPQKESFKSTLSFLVDLLDDKTPEISCQSAETLRTLLKFSGVFEECDEQMEIWIRCLFNIPNANERAEVVNWFAKSVKNAFKHGEKYLKIISDAEDFFEEKGISCQRMKNIFDELSEDSEAVRNRKNFVRMQKTVSIPVLLASALQELKKNSSTILPRFAAFVLTHTLHCQISPGPLLRLIEDFEKFPPYFAGWTIGQPTFMKKTLESLSIICKLSKIFIENNLIKAEDIFNPEKTAKELSEFDIISSLRMSVFYLTQFAQREIFMDTFNENCKGVIEFLLKEARQMDYKIFQECAKFLFTHPIILQLFYPLRQKNDETESLITNDTILEICRTVFRLNEKSTNQQLFLPFRNKMIGQLKKIIKKEKRKSKLNAEIVMEFLDLLSFNVEEIVSLLNSLLHLKKQLFLSKNNEKLSIFGHLLPKFLNLLCQKTSTNPADDETELDEKFVTKFSFYLTYFKRNEKIDLTRWEESFCNYLTTFPHQIGQIDSNSFFYLLQRKLNPCTVKLIALLCDRRPRIAVLFEKHASEKILREKSIVFPIIQENLTHKWGDGFLQKLKAKHSEEIVSYLTNPQEPKDWIEQNFRAVGFLIQNTFDVETCEKVCAIVPQIGDKLDLVSWKYVEILEKLFHRFSALSTEGKNPLTIFLQILLHVTTLTLKKESKNSEKLSSLCEKLRRTVEKLREGREDFIFEELAESHSWNQFTRFSLKMGLKKGPKENGINLLGTLTDLCDVAYKDNSENEYAKLMFDMTTSHSEFVSIMLAAGKDQEASLKGSSGAGKNSATSSENSAGCKRDLVEFLYTLIRKNKSVMSPSHVSLYLAAYNATLSKSDQFLLSILRLYESTSVRINDCRPYLWGNAAATHYSVKGEADTALFRQPSTSQVLNLLEPKIVQNTIANFPVNRDLTGVDNCDFEDIYDPAFYLPLLCHLLADNNVVACHRVMQTGGLALILASLASKCKDVRMTAYTALARFYFHLEGTSSKDKLLWMRLIDALRQGIVALKTELQDLRISGLVSTFLARASLIVTQPLNPLYEPLQNFLRVKPALELNAVPEFLQLFHSSDVEHLKHRSWILEVIRDGTKTEKDFQVAMKSMIFKMIMDFHSSVLADEESKRLILEVLEATLRIQKACRLLVERCGLIPWLGETANRLKNPDSRTLIHVVGIVETILQGFSTGKSLRINYRLVLLRILTEMKIQDLRDSVYVEKYLNTLRKVMEDRSVVQSVTREEISRILDSCKKVFTDVEDCDYLLRYGCQFQMENTSSSGAVVSLKRLISTWWKHRTS